MKGEKRVIRPRDYQIDAIAEIYRKFGVEPAGPDDDPIVAACRSDRHRENGHDVGVGEDMANRTDHACEPPF